jgi:uncharacterized protein
MSPPRPSIRSGRAGRPQPAKWRDSATRRELLALYGQADELLAGWSCHCAAPAQGVPACCDAGVIGREPYPTAVEMQEVREAIRVLGIRVSGTRGDGSRRLPTVGSRPCVLLSDNGRCRIYASRPLGCRTFFCDDAGCLNGPTGKLPRAALNAIGRRVADLSARLCPSDPLPRPLSKCLAGRTQAY